MLLPPHQGLPLHKSLVAMAIFILSALIGCGSSAPKLYYEGTMIKMRSPQKNERQRLIADLSNSLGKRSVFRMSRGQKKKVYGARKNRLKSLSHPELKAIFIAKDKKFIGAEIDLKVMMLDKKSSVPVTVWIALNQSITVEEGQWKSSRVPQNSREIEEKWRVGPLKVKRGAKWSKRALRSINIALSKLNSEERSLIKGIPVVRKKKGKDAQAALYIQQGDCKAFIHIFNLAIKSERFTFSGEAKAALPATVHPVLHEIGHAVHSYPSRMVHCEMIKKQNAFNRKVKRANKAQGSKRTKLGRELERERPKLERLIAKFKSLQSRGPVLKAYLKARGQSKGPTSYGETSDKESFAESFALYKVDPPALKRVMPRVFAWFKSEGHLKSIK